MIAFGNHVVYTISVASLMLLRDFLSGCLLGIEQSRDVELGEQLVMASHEKRCPGRIWRANTEYADMPIFAHQRKGMPYSNMLFAIEVDC